MITLRVQATATGRVVSWAKLKRGVIEDASRLNLFLMTTTLPNAMSDVLAVCHELDDGCHITTVVPNGFTTAALDLAITGNGFQVVCSRRLVRGFFPFNPIAAEFGRNYDVVVSVSAESSAVEERLLAPLRRTYLCTAMA